MTKYRPGCMMGMDVKLAGIEIKKKKSRKKYKQRRKE